MFDRAKTSQTCLVSVGLLAGKIDRTCAGTCTGTCAGLPSEINWSTPETRGRSTDELIKRRGRELYGGRPFFQRVFEVELHPNGVLINGLSF
jgi:hypothetical protein